MAFCSFLDSAIAGERGGIIVIGATNRIHAVDSAIIRHGRLERAIEIKPPDLPERINILRHLLEDELMNCDLTDVGEMMESATGAEIMELVRAARRVARFLGRPLLLDDLTKTILCPKEIPASALRRTSTHEAAHAVVATVLEVGDVKYARVQVRGSSSGYPQIQEDRSDLLTLDAVEDRLTAILAGRVAEHLILDTTSIGSGGSDQSELAIATNRSQGCTSLRDEADA